MQHFPTGLRWPGYDASCCPLLLAALPAVLCPYSEDEAEPEAEEWCWSCVAVSQIRPLQHHPVRTRDSKNLHREQLRNGQRVVGARHLYGNCKRTSPISPGWSCNGPGFAQILLSLQGPRGVIQYSILDISAQISSRTGFNPRSLHTDALQSCKLAAANLM